MEKKVDQMSIFLGMIFQNTTLFPAVLMLFLEPSAQIFGSKIPFWTIFWTDEAPTGDHFDDIFRRTVW